MEKVFLMIAVNEKDRDVLWFLWVDDVTKDEPEVRVYRFARVVFGVSSSPFLLNAMVKYHWSNSSIRMRMLLNVSVSQHMSMTSLLVLTLTRKHTSCMSKAKEIFRQGGFNLRKFLSNSTELQTKINETESTSDSNSPVNVTTNQGDVKVLGITWNPSSDSLKFDFRSCQQLLITYN